MTVSILIFSDFGVEGVFSNVDFGVGVKLNSDFCQSELDSGAGGAN